jgi:hypothetical protein
MAEATPLWQAIAASQLGLNFASKSRRILTRQPPAAWPQRNATLSFGRLLHSLWLRYFSKPAADRTLYRALRTRPVRSIVELGVGLPCRTPRILHLASGKTPGEPIRYCGIDLFEARPNGQPNLSLKQAFAALQSPRVRVQLVPGDPHSALKRVSNSLTSTDLLLIAADQDRDSLARAWIWMPRMLTTNSLVFVEEPGVPPASPVWKPISFADIQKLATESSKTVRRAA